MSRPLPNGGGQSGPGMAPGPGAAPGGPAGPGGQPASQAPANPTQVMLAQMFQVLRRLAQENPQMSAGLQKAAQGIQEAQTAMVMGSRPPAPEQSPPV